MYRNECGESSHGSFKVVFDERVSPRIVADAVSPWLRPSDTGVYGQLREPIVRYAGYFGLDAIEVTFDCGPWFGEAMLDRDQAGRLLGELTAAIAEYDRRESRRLVDPEVHHLAPECLLCRSEPATRFDRHGEGLCDDCREMQRALREAVDGASMGPSVDD